MGVWQDPISTQKFAMVGMTDATCTAVVAPATANTKGSWIELTSSTTMNASSIVLTVQKVSAAGTFLLDIGIGASGSEQIVLSNVLVAIQNYSEDRNPSTHLRIPLAIPEGTRIAARVQHSSTAEPSLYCGLMLEYGRVSSCGGITTYGDNTTDSGGSSVDSGAVANTKGSWAEITSATTEDVKGLFFCISNGGNIRENYKKQWLMDIGIGGAGSEEVIIPNIPLTSNSYADNITPNNTPIFGVSIPTGTRLVARAAYEGTNATYRVFDIIAYAII